MNYDEVVPAYEQDIEFVMGHAGTGKSTLLARWVTDKDIVLTPTHKAAKVLRAKGIKHVFTIHSVLRLVPTINMDFDPRKHRIQRLKKLGDVDLSHIERIYIDEFSMIPTHIMDYLLSLLPEKAKVTVFGDPYQLPPVDGEPIEPCAYTDKTITLTKQHRVNTPHITESFERLVTYLSSYGPMFTAQDLKPSSEIPRMPLKEALGKYDYDPAKDIILCFTNAKVLELNEIAHKYCKEHNLETSSWVINDQEVQFQNSISLAAEHSQKHATVDHGNTLNDVLYPTCISKGVFLTGSELHDCMRNTEREIMKYNTNIDANVYHAFVPQLEATYTFYASTNHYKRLQELEEEVKRTQSYIIDKHKVKGNVAAWCKSHRNASGVKERGRAWSDYIAFQSYVFDLRRPYARTVHKAQGSEFRTVYIHLKDLKKQRNMNMYARLLYVALSRAIEHAVIITD